MVSLIFIEILGNNTRVKIKKSVGEIMGGKNHRSSLKLLLSSILQKYWKTNFFRIRLNLSIHQFIIIFYLSANN